MNISRENGKREYLIPKFVSGCLN